MRRSLALQLEKAVKEALGGSNARRDSHFKRIMRVMSQIIDLDKQNNSEDVLFLV